MNKEKEYSFRVISNQVRFGCGYRTIDGKRQYFAWHGDTERSMGNGSILPGTVIPTETAITSQQAKSVKASITRSTKSIPKKSLPTEKKRKCSAISMLTVIR